MKTWDEVHNPSRSSQETSTTTNSSSSSSSTTSTEVPQETSSTTSSSSTTSADIQQESSRPKRTATRSVEERQSRRKAKEAKCVEERVQKSGPDIPTRAEQRGLSAESLSTTIRSRVSVIPKKTDVSALLNADYSRVKKDYPEKICLPEYGDSEDHEPYILQQFLTLETLEMRFPGIPHELFDHFTKIFKIHQDEISVSLGEGVKLVTFKLLKEIWYNRIKPDQTIWKMWETMTEGNIKIPLHLHPSSNWERLNLMDQVGEHPLKRLKTWYEWGRSTAMMISEEVMKWLIPIYEAVVVKTSGKGKDKDGEPKDLPPVSHFMKGASHLARVLQNEVQILADLKATSEKWLLSLYHKPVKYVIVNNEVVLTQSAVTESEIKMMEIFKAPAIEPIPEYPPTESDDNETTDEDVLSDSEIVVMVYISATMKRAMDTGKALKNKPICHGSNCKECQTKNLTPVAFEMIWKVFPGIGYGGPRHSSECTGQLKSLGVPEAGVKETTITEAEEASTTEEGDEEDEGDGEEKGTDAVD